VRVVIATGIFPPDIGGPATHAADMTAELVDRGHEVVVVTLTDNHVVTDEPGIVRYPRRWPWPLRTTATTWWFVRRRDDYDVIYATGLDLPAVLGAKLARRPVILKVVGDPAWERGRRRHLTDSDIDRFQDDLGGRASLRAMRAVRNWTVRHSSMNVTPSRYLQEIVGRWSGGRTPVALVPNGVRGQRPPRQLRDEHSAVGLRLVFVGRLIPHKRIDILIDALARTESVVLDVVGDGPELETLRRRAHAVGVGDRVAFLGSLSHPQVMERLMSVDALVSATSYEGLPHVVIEALVCGTPVVTTPAGGIVEVITDDVNGILIDPPDPSAFAAAFARLRDDPGLRTRLAAGADDTGRLWSLDQCIDEVERLLVSLTVRRPRAVFFGRGTVAYPPGDDLLRKLEIHARHLDQISIGTGSPRIRRLGGVRAVLLPDFSPRLLSSIAFYGGGSLLSLLAAARRPGTVIVCQSPYEAFGVVALRGLVPPPRRPRVQVEIHGDWRTAARLYGGRGRRRIAPFADRAAAWAIGRADRVRVVSRVLESAVRDVGYEGPIDRHLTYSNYDAFLVPPVPPSAVRRAAFVGGLERPKALDVLLDAWPLVITRVPDAELVIAGEGSLDDALRRRAADKGPSTIRFVGRLTRPELVRLLDSATCLVLPSRSEGVPRVIVEAMSRGRAVVATSVGGIPELVDETVGRVVPPEDVLALADAIGELLGDLPLAARLGDAARARAVARADAAGYESGIARLAAWADSIHDETTEDVT